MAVLEETFLTPEEVAERLKVDRETVLRLLRLRRLIGTKVGKLWRISPPDFARFLEEQRQQPKEDEPGDQK